MWFISDSCGISCCVATYCIMLTVSTIVTSVCIVPLSSDGYIRPWIWLPLYYLLLLLAGLSHLRCMLTDPGAIPKNSYEMTFEDPDSSNIITCLRCSCIKPVRTHHCSICERCISKMDHHCPWVNNCVGLYTQKHFILFLFYIMLSCGLSFVFLILRGFYCYGEGKGQLCSDQSAWVTVKTVLGLFAFFLAVVFCIFVCIMLFDQIQCIVENTSGIEMLKKTVLEERSVRENFEETFGGRFGVHWFLPTSVKGSIVIDPQQN